MNVKRFIFRALEYFFLLLDECATVGLAWVDRHYPDPELDDLIDQVEALHERAIAEQLREAGDNPVHLPRTQHRRNR